MTDQFDPKPFLKTCSTKPGVYKMLSQAGQVLYVGKAKNLKNRLKSYFQKKVLDPKTRQLVAQIAAVETIITSHEIEALILESNLIKEYKPKYNIIFRDDKSYPMIFIPHGHDFAELTLHRGAQRRKGEYYGPYPSAGAARQTLQLLQKIFRVRQCDDNFFKNRTRPCLQYQIKRCSGPCVGLISKEEYQKGLDHCRLFLKGKEDVVIQQLTHKMDQAAAELDYETAAQYRDQIQQLRTVQQNQCVSTSQGDVDVVGVATENQVACVQLLLIRQGHLLGNKVFYPKMGSENEEGEILGEFISQHYLQQTKQGMIPSTIILSHAVPEQQWLSTGLSELHQRKVRLVNQVRGERGDWQRLAVSNADQSLRQFLGARSTLQARYLALQEALQLEVVPTRMECFDISHSSGEATVASCVVFDENGPRSSDYRCYNIKEITPGDDYAALHQALLRRYQKLKETEGLPPELVIIDGGKGQLQQAIQVFEELQLQGIQLLSVAKGPERKPGMEVLFTPDNKKGLRLDPDNPGLHLIQMIRDEAHRFAITGHRQRRDKARKQSTLEQIPGIGAAKRRALLRHFGGLQAVQQASVAELAKVPGISNKLAQEIFDTLHA